MLKLTLSILFLLCPIARGTSLSVHVTLHPGAHSSTEALHVEKWDYSQSPLSVESSLTHAFGAASFSGTVKSYADYGVLKGYSSVTLNNYPAGSYIQDCEYGSCYIAQPTETFARFSDGFTITGGTGTGFLVMTLEIDGYTDLNTNLGDYTTSQGAASVYSGGNSYLNTGFVGGLNIIAVDPIPFVFEELFNIDVSFSSFQNVHDPYSVVNWLTGGNTYDLMATANFFNTLKVINFSVYEDQFLENKIRTFSLQADSGTSYSTDSVESTIPEPSTWVMMILGAPLGVWLRRKKKI